ncbi:MAG: prepilin-type cleavage/methylation domain-containing protein [Verrucomicrobia bacterium]|nr:prepilin-type cleavage/methylation domain-containing protein [Verrucomicrobiota bacterium]
MKPPTHSQRGDNNQILCVTECAPPRAQQSPQSKLAGNGEQPSLWRALLWPGTATLRMVKPRPHCGEDVNRPGLGAFTFVELLVVVAVLALGAILLVPAMARTQLDSRSARCLNNHGQLARAWLMYASDNNDKLATSYASVSSSQPSWAPGLLDWDLTPDNTNTVLLTDPRYSILATYFGKDARLFKCPADQYVSGIQRTRGWKERIRSISQNVYAGNGSSGFDPGYALVRKLTGLVNPKPAETWISIDEHGDSINDGIFFAPYSTGWIDLPAHYHDGGAGVAFADGHTEMHRWQGSVLKFPAPLSMFISVPPVTNDPDILWLRFRTPRQPGVN